MKTPRYPLILLAAVLLCGCAAPAPVSEPAPAVQATAAYTAAPTAEPAPDGEALLAAGDHRGAVDAFLLAAEQDPTNETHIRQLIDACLAAEKTAAGDFAAELTAAYEKLQRMDEATEQDTLALAELYARAGRLFDRCVLLETSQLLSPTDEKQAMLDALVIGDASGDAGAVLEQLHTALAGGDTDAACAVVLDDAAFSTLISAIPSTTRRYRTDSADGGVLRAELVQTLPGRERFTVWYVAADGGVTCLCRDAQTFSRVTARLENGAYTGAFTALFLDAAAGTVYTDAGTLQNGLWTGDVTATVAAGETAMSLQELWAARDAIPPVVYTGRFDDAGRPTAKQQKSADGAVYAYTDDNKAYLYLAGASATDAFGIDALKLSPVPEW